MKSTDTESNVYDFPGQTRGPADDTIFNEFAKSKKNPEHDTTTPVFSVDDLIKLAYIVKTEPTTDSNMGNEPMNELKNDQYIDQRFKNMDEKIDHRIELVSLKIDSLSENIKTNSEWMKKLVDRSLAEMNDIKNEGRKTRVTTVITGISVVLGLAALVFMLFQMQESWLQSFLTIFTQS
jgi:hypothetical protein